MKSVFSKVVIIALLISSAYIVNAQTDSNETANLNTLTEKEKDAGWKLLFNGKDLSGWHNFKRQDVRPGGQVKDGMLAAWCGNSYYTF